VNETESARESSGIHEGPFGQIPTAALGWRIELGALASKAGHATAASVFARFGVMYRYP
jgi:hypothetical protein